MTLQEQEACEGAFSDWYQLHGDLPTHESWQAGWAAALQWRPPRPSLFARCWLQVSASVVYAVRWLLSGDTKEELAARRRTRLTGRG